MADSKYKLTYFNVKGYGEFIRFIFHYAEVNFEDERVKEAEWPSLKEKQPYGVLPVLEVDGKVLNQSVVICRFLGKRFGLCHEDPFVEALLEAVVDNFRDTQMKMEKAFTEKTPEALKQGEDATKFLFDRLEPLAADGYFYGSKPTWVDIYFTGMIETLEDYQKNVLKGYPNLKGICEKIKSKDQVQEYIKNRPTPEFTS